MKKLALIKSLAALDRRGVYVLARRDLEKLFPEESEKAMDESLRRMCIDGILQRAARGLYVNPIARSMNRYVAEEVAKALRPGHLTYVSLESALSEYGAISQILLSRMTVMTTGSSGEINTPYGVIEFTHTKRSMAKIINRTIVIPGCPLRFASKKAALNDLRRVGRNVNMVDIEMLEEDAA